MMHIAYFSNQFADAEGHGLARYSHQLYAGLRAVAPELKVTPVAAWSSRDPAGVRALVKNSGLRILPWGRRLTPLVWAFLNGPPIEIWMDDSVDVVHVVSLGYPVATRKPFVVTVHDIGPLTHPEFFTNTRPWIMQRSLRQAVSTAAAIVCVSESTADELVAYAGNRVAERIHVIHEGVSPFFFEQPDLKCLDKLKELPGADVPLIVTTGKISPRKNVARVIRAFSKIASAIPHHLILVGGDGWDMQDVYKEITHPVVVERVHSVGYVSDDQLHALYHRAGIYIHPSFYEGFGLTVLEAMAAGCPVITSNCYSLPEIAGNAALFVDPYNVDEIADAMLTLSSDHTMSEDMRRRGKERAKEFSWTACAKQVAEVYHGVV